MFIAGLFHKASVQLTDTLRFFVWTWVKILGSTNWSQCNDFDESMIESSHNPVKVLHHSKNQKICILIVQPTWQVLPHNEWRYLEPQCNKELDRSPRPWTPRLSCLLSRWRCPPCGWVCTPPRSRASGKLWTSFLRAGCKTDFSGTFWNNLKHHFKGGGVEFLLQG